MVTVHPEWQTHARLFNTGFCRSQRRHHHHIAGPAWTLLESKLRDDVFFAAEGYTLEKTQTQVLSRARSIRLAFLIDLDEVSHPILDAIFDYSYSIWGGRFSLIVPCENGAPMPAFLPWLQKFDPDLIYSYVDLSTKRQQELHETLYPSALQHHWFGRNDHDVNYRPSPAISPLTVATLISFAGAPNAFDGTRGVRVIGAMGRMERDRFLSDSFGLPPPQLRNSMLGVQADSASMLLVVADDELHPRRSYIQESESTVADATALLTHMATNNRVTSLSQLSAMITPRLDLRYFRWSDTFNLVVGDTVPDRVLYWNARALMSPWRDGSDVDLCVPRAKFDDPAFIQSLREFLNRRNHVNGDTGGGSSRVTIRSVSLGADELTTLTEQLRYSKDWWVRIDHEQIASVADCIPEAKKLEEAFFSVGRPGFHAPNPWVESFSTSNELRLNATEPEHLRHIPTSLVNASSGAWAIDVDIERAVDHSPYSNVRHRWRLPLRLRVTSAFCKHYQISQPHGAFVAPRVSANGLLTLLTEIGRAHV